MISIGGHPLAYTFATALAISSAQASVAGEWPQVTFRIRPWMAPIFVVLLGLASLVFGILNPDTMALVGLEGITAP